MFAWSDFIAACIHIFFTIFCDIFVIYKPFVLEKCSDAYPYCKVEGVVAKLGEGKGPCTSNDQCEANLYCTPSILEERHCCNTG